MQILHRPYCPLLSYRDILWQMQQMRAKMQVTLKTLLCGLRALIDQHPIAEGRLAIQDNACAAIDEAIAQHIWPEPEGSPSPLSKPFVDVMTSRNAHNICQAILQIPFSWAPPNTSDNPLYVAHSHSKAHVELLGPQGIITSQKIRLGLYGILPDSEYGIRTHPAEEIFIMLAGEAEWLRGDDDYQLKKAGGYAYHPSMMPHATRTRHSAFMSVYIWTGDVSTDGYRYFGVPNAD